MSLRQNLDAKAEMRNVKTRIFDSAGSGLLVLIMLAVALIAAQSRGRETASDAPPARVHAKSDIATDGERRAILKSPMPVIATVTETATEVESSLDEPGRPQASIPDADETPVHYE